MKSPKKETLLSLFVFTLAIIIVLSVLQGFSGGRSLDGAPFMADSTLLNKGVDIPDEVTFAGERMPLENFDTRESLDRELLTGVYRHSSTILIIKRANRYLPVIEKILKSHGIPDDFKYLAAAESEYSNMVSPAGATGFWQIMPETGKEEGMEINNIVDERYDIEKSTRFACEYFRKSFERYGNWTLAAASYNGGRAGIDEQVAIQHQNDYYNLLLSEETARYIFRVVAYKLIISDPARYGFNLTADELYPELEYYVLKVDTAVSDFSAFAAKFGTNYKLLKLLNPWLRKPYLTPKPGKTYLVKIPADGMRDF
jgi:hypothetical protein